MSKSDRLELIGISTDDLIDELFDRYDHCSLIVRKDLNEKEFTSLKKYKGGYHMNLGLLAELTHHINNKIIEEYQILDDEELKDI